jgi:hypothetical protein
MRPQKVSAQTKFRDPADLIDKFLHFVSVLLVVPHDTILYFEVRVDA